METIKCRVCDFGVYGLNKYRNFLNAGGTENLDTKEELFEFIGHSLIDHGCPCSAIFAIGYNDVMYCGFMSTDVGEYGEVFFGAQENFDLDFFASMDAEMRFCCYALLIEIRPSIWRIVI